MENDKAVQSVEMPECSTESDGVRQRGRFKINWQWMWSDGGLSLIHPCKYWPILARSFGQV